MDSAQNGPNASGSTPGPDDDTYAVREPVEVTARPTIPPLRRVPLNEVPDEPHRPPATNVSFFSGVFSFPFYPRTLPAWALVSLALTIPAEGIVLCFWLADRGLGDIAARCFGLPVILVGIFGLSYTSACFVAVLEQTAEGQDTIVDWPSGLWRDWFWTMPTTLGMAVLPAVILAVGGRLTGFGSWWLESTIVQAVYPVLLLSALDNGSPLAPVSGRVLRSLGTVWWCWLLAYSLSIPVAIAWYLAVERTFTYQPFLVVLVAASAAAVILFVYARLLGRLFWYAGPYDDECDVGD